VRKPADAAASACPPRGLITKPHLVISLLPPLPSST